ncbi:MAG TPA: M48 family metallopeptidase [Candidatus Saccharimonadales bacterium]|nr:M48 family metallopeptidase [Candidatus Saccharimonadales bacterium]
MQRNFPVKALTLFLALLIAVPAPLGAQSTPQLPNPGSPAGVSKQDQEQLGLKASAEVYKQMPVLPDSSPITQYVRQLGRKLGTVIPAENSWPYQFHVIPQKEINAFALPGGPIFINIGTIQAADNEAELAGVMAHEMSHVYMQHSAKQASKASLANVLVGIAGAVMPGGAAGNLARLGIQIGASGIFMKYSRADEAQADAVGAVIMYKAGYNPKSLADFFQKLEQETGAAARSPQFLSDHPNPGNRQAAIAKQIRPWAQKKYLGSSDGFYRAHQEAGKIKAYTAQEIAAGAKSGQWAQQNQADGVVPTNLPPPENGNGGGSSSENISGEVKPSSHFQQLQNGFSISHPDNWRPGEGFGGTTIAPPAGISSSAISYGVIVADTPMGNGSSLDQSTEELINGLVQSNPGMKTTGATTSIQVGGAHGRSAYLTGNSPIQLNGQPIPERDWVVTVQNSQGAMTYLVFVAPDRDFNQLHPVFQKMLESFKPR